MPDHDRIVLRTAALAGLLAALASGCSGDTSAEPPAVLLEDDFNTENGGSSRLNYTAFLNWEVVDGSVDLIGTPPYHDLFPPEYRIAVDLDGTTLDAGRLQSRTSFALSPGTYTLSFDMAGMPRNTPSNTVVVSLGDAFGEQITVASFTTVVRHTRKIRVTKATSAKLAFDHHGGDNFGIVLDNVRLARE